MGVVYITYAEKLIATVWFNGENSSITLHDPDADTVSAEEGKDPPKAIADYLEHRRRLYRMFEEVDNIPDPYDDELLSP